MCVFVCEMEVILCSRDDSLRGCLAGGEQVFPASGVPVVSSAAVPKLWMWPSKHVIKHSVPFQALLPTFRNGAY